MHLIATDLMSLVAVMILKILNKISGTNIAWNQTQLNSASSCIADFEVKLTGSRVNIQSGSCAYEMLALARDISNDRDLPWWFKPLKLSYLEDRERRRQSRAYLDHARNGKPFSKSVFKRKVA